MSDRLRVLPHAPEPGIASPEAKATVLQLAERQLRSAHALHERLCTELGLPTYRHVAQNIVSALQATGKVPRVHGNGFIQLDLLEHMRLHVWGDPRIPRQASPSPIHDHRFGFISYVLRGAITNAEYIPVVGGQAFREWRPVPRDGEDTVLTKTDTVAHFVEALTQIPAGRMYGMDPGRIHDSRPHGVTITVMAKTVIEPQYQPRVYLPEGQEPDNDFNRNTAAPQELLWQIIEDAVCGAV